VLKRRPVEMQIEQAGISVSAAADSSSVRASKSRPSDTTGFLGVRHAAISSCRPLSPAPVDRRNCQFLT